MGPEEIDSDDDLSSFLQSLHNKYSHLLDQTAIATAPAPDATEPSKPLQASTDTSKVQASRKLVPAQQASDVAASPFKTKLRQVQDSLQQLRNSLALPQLSRTAAAPITTATTPSTRQPILSITKKLSPQLSWGAAEQHNQTAVQPSTPTASAKHTSDSIAHLSADDNHRPDKQLQPLASHLHPSSNDSAAASSAQSTLVTTDAPGTHTYPQPPAPTTLLATTQAGQEPSTAESADTNTADVQAVPAGAAVADHSPASVRSSLSLPEEGDAFYTDDDVESAITASHTASEGYALRPPPGSPQQQHADPAAAPTVAQAQSESDQQLARERDFTSDLATNPAYDMHSSSPAPQLHQSEQPGLASDRPADDDHSLLPPGDVTDDEDLPPGDVTDADPHTQVQRNHWQHFPSLQRISLHHAAVAQADTEAQHGDSSELQPAGGAAGGDGGGDAPPVTSALPDAATGVTMQHQGHQLSDAPPVTSALRPQGHQLSDVLSGGSTHDTLHASTATAVQHPTSEVANAEDQVGQTIADGAGEWIGMDDGIQEEASYVLNDQSLFPERRETWESSESLDHGPCPRFGQTLDTTTLMAAQPAHDTAAAAAAAAMHGSAVMQAGSDASSDDASYETDDSLDSLPAMPRITLIDLPDVHLINQVQMRHRTATGSGGGAKPTIELKPFQNQQLSFAHQPTSPALAGRDQGRRSPPVQRVLFSDDETLDNVNESIDIVNGVPVNAVPVGTNVVAQLGLTVGLDPGTLVTVAAARSAQSPGNAPDTISVSRHATSLQHSPARGGGQHGAQGGAVHEGYARIRTPSPARQWPDRAVGQQHHAGSPADSSSSPGTSWPGSSSSQLLYSRHHPFSLTDFGADLLSGDAATTTAVLPPPPPPAGIRANTGNRVVPSTSVGATDVYEVPSVDTCTAQSEQQQHDTIQPDATQPDATQVAATQVDTTEPRATQPEATQPTFEPTSVTMSAPEYQESNGTAQHQETNDTAPPAHTAPDDQAPTGADYKLAIDATCAPLSRSASLISDGAVASRSASLISDGAVASRPASLISDGTLTTQRKSPWRRPPKISPQLPTAHTAHTAAAITAVTSTGSSAAASVTEQHSTGAVTWQPSLQQGEGPEQLGGLSQGGLGMLMEGVGQADWEQAHHALIQAGFAGLKLQKQTASGIRLPASCDVLDVLSEVLHQYTRRQQLVSDLLAATELAAQNETALEQSVMEAQRDVVAARRAQDKAEQRADALQNQELPRLKTEHQAQMSKLHSQVANMKQQLKDWETKTAAKDQEIKALNATIQSLQLSSSQGADSDLAGLRVRVTQLEVLLKSKEKELDRAKSQSMSSQNETAEDKAAALERAFAAEDASQRLSTELLQLRSRLQQLEHASVTRERELTSALSDSDAKLSSQLAALELSDSRAAAAEETARAATCEAAQAKSRAGAVEASLRASQKEVVRLKADMEAMRGAMYDEVYKMEDEVRRLKEELGTRASRVSQLEHVIKAKDREIGRAKEDKDAGRAADKERVKVAEEVATRLEAELQAMKQKAAQMESSLRISQRETQSLEEALRAARGSEYEGLVKHSKAEEGVKRVETELAVSKMRVLQLEGQLKAKDKEVQGLSRAAEGQKAEIHEAAARVSRLEEVIKHLEGSNATGRSKVLSLEASIRVKDREVDRLTRVLEAVKASETQQSLRISSLEDALRRAEGDLASSRVRVTQLEGVVKSKETTLDKLQGAQEALRAEQVEAEQRRLAVEEAVKVAGEEAAAARQRVVQLEGLVKSKDKELDRIRKALDGNKTSEVETLLKCEKVEEEARAAAAETAGMKQRLAQVESSLRSAEREGEKQQRHVTAARAAEQQARVQQAQLEEVIQKLETELAGVKQQVVVLEGKVKSRDKEMAGLQKKVEAGKTVEYDTAAAKLQTEEAARALDSELASARQRVLHLEGQLKSRDKEVDRLNKSLDGLKAAEFDSELQIAERDETLRLRDQSLASLRSKVQQLESQLRSKDKEVTRITRLVDAAKASEAALSSAKSEAEAAVSQLESEIAALKVKVMQLEGSLRLKANEVARAEAATDTAVSHADELADKVSKAEAVTVKAQEEAAAARGKTALLDSNIKVKEREIDRLSRLLEAARSTEYELTAAKLQAQEACRACDEQLAGARQRVVQLEGQLKSRDKEVDRLNKLIDSFRSTELDLTSKQLQTQAVARQLDTDVGSLRTQLLTQEGLLRARTRDVDRLTRQLESAGGASAAELKELQETVQKLTSELANVRSKVLATEASLKSKESEITRLNKMLDSLRASEADFSSRASCAEEAQRRAEAAAEAAKQKAAQLEQQLSARGQEVSQLKEGAERAVADALQAVSDMSRAQEDVRRAQSQAQTQKQKAQQLDCNLKSRDKEIERLSRLLESVKAELGEALARAAKLEEANQKLEGDAGSLRNRIAHVEASNRVKDKELERVSKLLSSAQIQGSTATHVSEEVSRHAADELSEASRRITQLEGILRSRDREVATTSKALDSAKTALIVAQDQLSSQQADQSQLEFELQSCRQRLTQQESVIKARDKEVERLTRQLESARSDVAGAEVAAGRGTARLTEEIKRLESALAQAQARCTQAESQLASRDKEVAAIQRSDTWQKDAQQESYAAASVRAARAEDQLKRAEQDVAQLKAKAAQLERTLRNRELAMDKLKGVLADKVTKEERLVARDKQVYARLKSAFAAHRADLQAKKAAGAISAAARELRPVEIVGVYEQQREQLECEAAQLRTEVRLLSEQLRDAQNLISLKDRTGGWRNPAADAEIQTKVSALERRCAELNRELSSARDQAADGLRVAERKAAEAQHRAQALAEENDALLTELHARPTLQEHRSLKREIDILERRILDLRHGKSDARDGGQALAAAGARAEGAEMMLGVQAASRSSLSSRERIRRDKELHRLGLKSVEDIPREVLVDLVQDVCIELNTPDATLLVTATRKLLRVVEAVPRMEAFIAQVCEVVYTRGAAWIPDAITGGPHDPTKVVGVLHNWVERLHEHQAMQAGLTQLSSILSSRMQQQQQYTSGGRVQLTPQEVVVSVQQLVMVEAQALVGATVLHAAEQLLHQASPQDLLANTVKHFQQLFDCHKLESVVPVMNKVYMTLSELRNFLHSLIRQLGLPDNTSTAGCAAAVQQTLDTLAHLKQQHQGGGSALTQQQPIVALHQEQGGNGLQAGEDVIQHLQQLFNATSPDQLKEGADRLIHRLQRLDGILPRYQTVTSQLYDLLRVQSLDELVPAVRRLVAMTTQG